jgi:dethiobiotin synthetase
MRDVPKPSPKRPGLFITGTDTGVGKTVATCAIAAAMRRQRESLRIGVCKPVATGCRREREGWVSEDAEALAYWSDCRQSLQVINPLRYREPLAPATAAERAGEPLDWAAIAESIRLLDEANDIVLVEGVGGVMTPLDEHRSVLDLAAWLGYPVVVVTRPGLGTLNHTALTCAAIRAAGLRLAGLVIRGFDPDSMDTAEITNPAWLARQNRTTILVSVPRCDGVAPHQAKLPEEIIAAAETVDWLSVCAAAR